MKLIGLKGKKQSGKNACAEAICRIMMQQGYTPVIVGFADSLKTELAELFATEPLHIEKIKNNPAMRWILQRYGTEYRRNENANYWIQQMDEKLKYREEKYNYLIVIPDVRFQNEQDWIKSKGGWIFNVNRPSLKDVEDNHASEQLADRLPYDYNIVNDRTLNGIESLVKYALQHVKLI